MRLLITTIKSWNIENAQRLKEKDSGNDWNIITNKEKFTQEIVKEIDPQYIFVPHWSWMIPEEIWEIYETVVFHPTDLPFGRGGTPIQNQIIRGIYDVKLSALRVNEEIDGGPIYLKRDFNMSEGNVDEILSRASRIYFEDMIPQILSERMAPVPQQGEVISYKRRKPSQSNLGELGENVSPRKLYDFIRMLDGEGYPPAYLPLSEGMLEFYGARFRGDGLEAKVKFKKR